MILKPVAEIMSGADSTTLLSEGACRELQSPTDGERIPDRHVVDAASLLPGKEPSTRES